MSAGTESGACLPDPHGAWHSRRVLVTGATGFIGSAVAARLLELGAVVHGAATAGGAAPFPITACDLSIPEQCEKLMAGSAPEIVFHLAGHPFAARDLAHVIPTFRDNLATTVNILTCSVRFRVGRVVLAGSLEEPAEPGPSAVMSSPYALSKSSASAYARLFHAQFGLSVVVARLFMVYGPGQRDPHRLIPSAIHALLRGQAPRVSAGQRGIDWVYIDDAVEGLLAAARAPGIDGGTVDIGTGTLTTVRSVVELLADLVPGAAAPVFGAVPTRPHEQVAAARLDQTRGLLGWGPRVALREGLARTIEWCRSRASTWLIGWLIPGIGGIMSFTEDVPDLWDLPL